MSLRIGAVFDLSGPESAVGAMQAHASELAVEQLNSAGGITLRTESAARRLTLIICDRALDGHKAVATLVKTLGVRAMLGPACTQSFAQVASDVAIPDDLILLGPGALSEAVRDSSAGALTRGMTLSEADRVPMLISQLRALSSQLTSQASPLELAVVMRADAPMTSVRIAKAQLAPSDHASMIDLQQVVTSYEYRDDSELAAIAAKLALKPPHIILADGASEVANALIAPLEAMLATDARRPSYLLGEAAQVPQLLKLAQAQPTLQARVSVIGAVPINAAQPVYTNFEGAYRRRYAEGPRAVTGVAASYSAVYAFAFGLMAADDPLHYGTALALGMRQLTGGALSLTTAPDDVSRLLDALTNKQAVTVTGALADLGWTDSGSPRGARVGVYCLGQTADGWSFVSTGYHYDIASGALQGSATPCQMWRGDASSSPSQTGSSAGEAASSGSGSEPETSSDKDAGMPTSTKQPDAGIAAADSGAATRELVPTDMGLAVQYYPLNNSLFDGVVAPAIRIINRSASEDVPLCSLSARYYFTNEYPEACPDDCRIDGFYNGLQPSGASTPAERSYHEAGGDEPSAYLEIKFPCSSTQLGVGESVELQQQFHLEPYRDFDESDDYSFNFFATDYVDTRNITLYLDGKLVWGMPPR